MSEWEDERNSKFLAFCVRVQIPLLPPYHTKTEVKKVNDENFNEFEEKTLKPKQKKAIEL